MGKFVELLLIAVGLSMDAFAVSVCKGLAMKRCTWSKGVIVGLYFGIFQAGMPAIGYFLGVQFKDVITFGGSLDRFHSAWNHRRKHDLGSGEGGRGL